LPKEWTYEERLKIPVDGSAEIDLYTESGVRLTKGYRRVVIGERGPYVEFGASQLRAAVAVPEDQLWRITSDKAFYLHFEPSDEPGLKIYWQKRTVDYADYRPNCYYVSPFDLRNEIGETLIDPLSTK
jgi:hypothetical protein